jgi:uncharacterized protein involved in copper resistance
MKRYAFAVLTATALLLSACGGKETMASRSAAAFREAQAKGVPVTGGDEHGGHTAAPSAAATADGMAGMDHSTMPGMDHSTMKGMDHSTMKGMDHSTMPAMDHSTMPGMDHSAMSGTDHSTKTGMDHSTMPGMNHTQMQPAAGAPSVVLGAPKSSAEIARTEPAATLQADAFDAPAAAAVAESQKAAGGGGHAAHDAAAPAAPADPHAGHEQARGSSAQALYVCPMHPEVTSATPGTCPKCGMTLVKKEH